MKLNISIVFAQHSQRQLNVGKLQTGQNVDAKNEILRFFHAQTNDKSSLELSIKNNAIQITNVKVDSTLRGRGSYEKFLRDLVNFCKSYNWSLEISSIRPYHVLFYRRLMFTCASSLMKGVLTGKLSAYINCDLENVELIDDVYVKDLILNYMFIDKSKELFIKMILERDEHDLDMSTATQIALYVCKVYSIE